MSDKINMDKDIEILFDTEIGIGYGYVYEAEGNYISLVYQARLDQSLIDEHKSHSEITEKITYGKAFVSKHGNVTAAINDVLDFYLIPELSVIPEIKKVSNLHGAINQLSLSNGYLIFQMENENVLEEVSEISI